MVKALALVSGGIDSIVAVALALEQGMEIEMLHFSTVPLGNTRGLEKTKLLARTLGEKFGQKIKVGVAPHGNTLFAIAKNCHRKYSCVLCRRIMLRAASRIAEKRGASALITGEAIGQVASQTLFNLNAEHSASLVPIIRPLIGMDKLEIERLAKEFGTFETSILPSACCSIPAKPATKATSEKVEQEEKRLNVNELVEKELEKADFSE